MSSAIRKTLDWGGLAEETVAHEVNVFLKPKTVGFVEAIQLAISYPTSAGALTWPMALDVQRGQTLLVHAAAGGVGLLVCSWARRLGAVVVGTVSSEEKAHVAREHGCTHPIVTREHRFADAVQAQFGGADVIVDGIGDAARDENFAALARRGHWISLGQASGALQPIATDQLVQKSITFSRPAVFDYVATNAHLAERAERVWAALADGTLKVPPIERHSLGAAAAAHARLESRRTIGALVLIA